MVQFELSFSNILFFQFLRTTVSKGNLYPKFITSDTDRTNIAGSYNSTVCYEKVSLTKTTNMAKDLLLIMFQN